MGVSKASCRSSCSPTQSQRSLEPAVIFSNLKRFVCAQLVCSRLSSTPAGRWQTTSTEQVPTRRTRVRIKPNSTNSALRYPSKTKNSSSWTFLRAWTCTASPTKRLALSYKTSSSTSPRPTLKQDTGQTACPRFKIASRAASQLPNWQAWVFWRSWLELSSSRSTRKGRC